MNDLLFNISSIDSTKSLIGVTKELLLLLEDCNTLLVSCCSSLQHRWLFIQILKLKSMEGKYTFFQLKYVVFTSLHINMTNLLSLQISVF